LSSIALTDQLVTKIRTDTQAATDEKARAREAEMARLSKSTEVISAYAAIEGVKERHVSLQDFGGEAPTLPTSFNPRDTKWKYMPYHALQRVFEFHGEWGLNRVSRRWYDCFMNYDFAFETKTEWLLRAMSKCIQSITSGMPGWSEEHSSFWRKLTECHTEPISLLTALPTIPSHIQLHFPHVLKKRYLEWVLHEVVRPCFAIRDRILLDHLCRNFDDRTWIRATMKSEFCRITRYFVEMRRFPLFLQEYGYLMEEFGFTPTMMDEMMKLPTGKGPNTSEQNAD
jgi:hypothetical protein